MTALIICAVVAVLFLALVAYARFYCIANPLEQERVDAEDFGA